jgi:hypothetical protein
LAITKRIDQFDPKASLTGSELLLIQDPTSLAYNRTTLALIAASAGAAPVSSVAGKTGAVTLTKSDVGLSNVDNTADTAKPVSTATQTALNGKQDTIAAGTTAQYYRGDKTFQTLNQDAVPSGTTNKAYTATEQTKLAAISGTNTGDETTATIKTKLGISTLSGSNTGDQDLSSYATTSALTTGLSAKQDTLVSGTTIKTINGTSLLGSGNLTIVGGGGGTGNVTGPATSTDNAVVRFDGTTGQLIQDSGLKVDDLGNVTVNGKLTVGGSDFPEGLNVVGNFSVDDADTPTKSYRYRTSGANLDWEIGGSDLFMSAWNNADYTGTQRFYLRLEAGAQIAHAIGQWVFSDNAYGSTNASIDGATGKVTATSLQVTGGTPAAGKVLTSDSSGNATWQTAGNSGIVRSIATSSANVTLGATASTDYVSICTGGTTYTTTLPTAVGNTNLYTVKNSSTVVQTIATTSSQTIDGSTTISITPNTAIDVISNGANWVII